MPARPAPVPISPLPLDDWPAQLRDMLSAAVRNHRQVVEPPSGETHLNIVATLAHHPTLAIAFGQLSAALTFGDLPARDREMIILRTAYLNRSTYEWSHHCPLAKRAGLSDTDIARIGSHPDAEEWSAQDKALLAAVDELHRRSTISSTTGHQLAQHYQPRQLLELIYLAGTYRTVTTMLHACQVPLDDGIEALPLPPGDEKADHRRAR